MLNMASKGLKKTSKPSIDTIKPIKDNTPINKSTENEISSKLPANLNIPVSNSGINPATNISKELPTEYVKVDIKNEKNEMTSEVKLQDVNNNTNIHDQKESRISKPEEVLNTGENGDKIQSTEFLKSSNIDKLNIDLVLTNLPKTVTHGPANVVRVNYLLDEAMNYIGENGQIYSYQLKYVVYRFYFTKYLFF